MAGLLLATGHSARHPVRSLRRQRTYAVIRAYVLADRLQPLQNALPLCPVELSQVRAKTLDERIFENCLPICFRYEEAIQSDTQRFGNFFKRAETGSHLSALDP